LSLYHLGVILALVLFAFSSIFFLQSFAVGATRDRIYRIAYSLFMLATVLMVANTVNVFVYNIEHLLTPFILITSLCLMTFIGRVVFGFRVLGPIVAPLSLLIILIQFLFVPPHGPAETEGPTALIYTHIVTSLLGEAFAIIAFIFAVFYLIQQRAMKQKQIGRLAISQVSISRLSSGLMVTLLSGFILMTIGLILGAIYTQFYVVGDSGELVGKIIWAFLVWGWYLATLVGRNLMNLTAKKLAWMTIIGFGLLSLGMFGINFWSALLG
jgi:ABC-type uncharacterized transport system permease subunit